jgi:hypothetical protein
MKAGGRKYCGIINTRNIQPDEDHRDIENRILSRGRLVIDVPLRQGKEKSVGISYDALT